MNSAGEQLLEIALNNRVCGANLAGGLFDCSDSYLPGPRGWEIINYATTAAFEEILYCRDTNPWAEIERKYPDVTQFEEDL